MLSRGLLEEDVTRYGTLPRTKQERAVLAGILNDYVSARFPAYGHSHSGGVVGIPGFGQELSGVVHIWKPRNYLMRIQVARIKRHGHSIIDVGLTQLSGNLRPLAWVLLGL